MRCVLKLTMTQYLLYYGYTTRMGFITFIDLTWSVTTALFSNHYLTQQVFAELLTEFDHYMRRSEVVLPFTHFWYQCSMLCVCLQPLPTGSLEAAVMAYKVYIRESKPPNEKKRRVHYGSLGQRFPSHQYLEASKPGCLANRSCTTHSSAIRLTSERMAPHNRTSWAPPSIVRGTPAWQIPESSAWAEVHQRWIVTSIPHRSLLRLLYLGLPEMKGTAKSNRDGAVFSACASWHFMCRGLNHAARPVFEQWWALTHALNLSHRERRQWN